LVVETGLKLFGRKCIDNDLCTIKWGGGRMVKKDKTKTMLDY